MSKLADDFKRIVVLYNPASTHAQQAKKRIEALQAMMPKDRFLLLHTSTDGRESNKTLLHDHADWLGPDTLLCIAAGDGTVNVVVEALASCEESERISDNAGQTVLLPLWGGNANDIAHMLNGPAYRMPIEALLSKGRVVEIKPLCCTLATPGDSPVTHLAVGYVSFGATALAARRLNEPPHRSSRLHKAPGGRPIQELLTVLRALVKAPSFRIKERRGERFIYDRMFINGSRIGKFGALPVRLTDDHYYETTVSEKRLSATIARFRELLRRPALKKAPQVTHFTCLDEAWAQFDGETVKVPAGTSVTVQHAERSLRAWSVRLED